LLEREKGAQQQRIDEGKLSLPPNQRLLAAMQNGLPACTGVALGFDRVVMLACGARHIDEVLAFPIDRA
jgi:lysyl-tRNA synthetase class 2